MRLFFARWPHFFGGELEKRFTKSCFGFCGGPVFDDHQHENCVTLICTSPNSFVMPYWTNRYELEKNGRQVFPNNCFSFCMCQAGLLLLFTAAFSSFVRKLVSRSVVSSSCYLMRNLSPNNSWSHLCDHKDSLCCIRNTNTGALSVFFLFIFV